MLALSKLIRAYANKTNNDPRKEDYFLLCCLVKIANCADWFICFSRGITNMSSEKYNVTKEYVQKRIEMIDHLFWVKLRF